jgi:hypothetical protein
MLLMTISKRTTRREMMSAGYLQLRYSSGAGSAIGEACAGTMHPKGERKA